MTLLVDDSSNVNSSFVWRSNSRLLQEGPSKAHLLEELKGFFSNNADSVSDHMVLWNTHKAYMRGIFIQLGARVKRQRRQRIQEILSDIRTLEAQNKKQTSLIISDKLSQLRHSLRIIMLEDFERASKRLKMSYHVSGNKAGKL